MMYSDKELSKIYEIPLEIVQYITKDKRFKISGIGLVDHNLNILFNELGESVYMLRNNIKGLLSEIAAQS